MIDEKKLIEDIEKEFVGVCVYDVSPSQAVTDFIEIVDRQPIIDKQPRVGEWIPCSDCLPDDHGTRLVTLSNGTVEGAYYSNDNWWCIGDSINLEIRPDVIAWMPLPPAYKEGE